MRWESLFDDLEAQLVADEQRDLESEVADRTRRERAQLGLQERLTALLDVGVVGVRIAGAGPTAGAVIVSGRVCGVGADWLLVEEREDRPALVPFAAVRAVTGLRGAAPTGAVAKAFGLGAALRAISRDRSVVELLDLDHLVMTGTIDAVGQDVFDLAEHPADLPRRHEHVVAVRTVPFQAVALIRRR